MTDILDLTNQAMDDIPESELLEENSEAELRIVNVTIDKNKNDEPYILPLYDIPESPNVDEFSHYMALPFNGQDPVKNKKAKRRLAAWAEAFGFDLTEKLDVAEMRGARGWAILGVERDDEYGDKMRVKRYVSGS